MMHGKFGRGLLNGTLTSCWPNWDAIWWQRWFLKTRWWYVMFYWKEWYFPEQQHILLVSHVTHITWKYSRFFPPAPTTLQQPLWPCFLSVCMAITVPICPLCGCSNSASVKCGVWWLLCVHMAQVRIVHPSPLYCIFWAKPFRAGTSHLPAVMSWQLHICWLLILKV